MAFLEAEELTLDELLLDVDGLTEGLLFHVVDDLLVSTDLEDGDQSMTLAGDAVLAEVAEGSVMVGGAAVVQVISRLIMEFAPDGAVLTPYIEGCTDEDACNYDDDATVDDGSCYELEVTTDRRQLHALMARMDHLCDTMRLTPFCWAITKDRRY